MIQNSVRSISQEAFRRVLLQNLSDGRVRNPSFSQRALARRLGIGSSALSEFLNGKRQISQSLATRIADRLGLGPEQRQEYESEFRPDQKSRIREAVQIDMNRYHLISEWQHFAILSLAETQGFKSDPIWIAARLGISITKASQGIDRLVRLGLLRRGRRGNLVITGQQFTTSDEVAHLSLRRSYAEDLELARASLDGDSVEIRDFTAITMALDPERIPIAKRMIREFRDALCVLMESGNKKEVYKLCIQLIPLSESSRIAKGG